MPMQLLSEQEYATALYHSHLRGRRRGLVFGAAFASVALLPLFAGYAAWQNRAHGKEIAAVRTASAPAELRRELERCKFAAVLSSGQPNYAALMDLVDKTAKARGER